MSFSFQSQTASAFGLGQNLLFLGCQCLWARPLHSCHILLRGYRLLVPSRLGPISYHIRVSTYFIPFTTFVSFDPGVAFYPFEGHGPHFLIFFIMGLSMLAWLIMVN